MLDTNHVNNIHQEKEKKGLEDESTIDEKERKRAHKDATKEMKRKEWISSRKILTWIVTRIECFEKKKERRYTRAQNSFGRKPGIDYNVFLVTRKGRRVS
uniref:Uncharacterized protein n=1 Tax=Cacopsylla melanoneura TaxID=428564 RepID=A0A8D8LHL7_9HEMI